jgi:uncharacterized RDD family membrane protein YckC
MKEDNNVTQHEGVKENLHNGDSSSKRVPLPVALIANIVDQIIIAVIAIVMVYVVDFIMQFAGYYISEKLQMFLIFYIVCNLIYTPLFESSKKLGTPGKMLFKAKVTSK